MISEKLVSLFKEKYGPDSFHYWPEAVESAESKALELATTMLECAIRFETSKTYRRWNDRGIQTIDQFNEANNNCKKADSLNFKSFLTNDLNNPSSFTSFSKVQTNACNEFFESKSMRTKTLEVFKKEISFLQHARFWKLYWDYENIVYSAIFYISEYYKNRKKEIPSFFLTIITNQILFVCHSQVEQVIFLLEDTCFDLPQKRSGVPKSVVVSVKKALKENFTAVKNVLENLKKVSPLFAENNKKSRIFLNLTFLLEKYFNKLLKPLRYYVRLQIDIFAAQNVEINIDWNEIKNHFDELSKEIKKAVDCANPLKNKDY